jgi:DNA replication protein DnaC
MLNSKDAALSNARDILLNIDYLVIDEFDTRFMGSENAADLFGRILEPIMRTRIQNRMPLFFCTNSIKVEGSFSGPLQASIKSLMNMVTMVIIVGGQDAREKIKRGEL